VFRGEGEGGDIKNYAEISDFTEDFEKRELFSGSTFVILTDFKIVVGPI